MTTFAKGIQDLQNLGIIGTVLLAIVIAMFVDHFISKSGIRKLHKLYIVWEKLPGLRSYKAFKEYEELFESVRDGHIKIKEPIITKSLGKKIDWLIRLSKSSAAELWESDATVVNAVLEVFTELNEIIRYQEIYKQLELEKFKRMIEEQ